MWVQLTKVTSTCIPGFKDSNQKTENMVIGSFRIVAAVYFLTVPLSTSFDHCLYLSVYPRPLSISCVSIHLPDCSSQLSTTQLIAHAQQWNKWGVIFYTMLVSLFLRLLPVAWAWLNASMCYNQNHCHHRLILCSVLNQAQRDSVQLSYFKINETHRRSSLFVVSQREVGFFFIPNQHDFCPLLCPILTGFSQKLPRLDAMVVCLHKVAVSCE